VGHKVNAVAIAAGGKQRSCAHTHIQRSPIAYYRAERSMREEYKFATLSLMHGPQRMRVRHKSNQGGTEKIQVNMPLYFLCARNFCMTIIICNCWPNLFAGCECAEKASGSALDLAANPSCGSEAIAQSGHVSMTNKINPERRP